MLALAVNGPGSCISEQSLFQVGDAGVATVTKAEGIGSRTCFLYLE
jgi:hypothetical protein